MIFFKKYDIIYIEKNKKENLKEEVASMSKKATEELRLHYTEFLANLLSGAGEEILRAGSNELAIPCVDSEGEDSWITVTIKVPTGSREGDPYDGYAMAEEYTMKQKTKAERDKANAEKKARKIARDEAARKAKAEAKARREEG